MGDTTRISAAKAPINEVAFGVVFRPLPLKTVHFGIYGETLKSEFPHSSDQAPIIDGGVDLGESIQGRMFPLPRVWYEGLDGMQLIQLQPNRFHLNWRRRSQKDAYPKYETLKPKFLKHWELFSKWVQTNADASPSVNTYELTYTNLVDASTGWHSPSDYARLFSFINLESSLPSLSGFATTLVFNNEQVGQIQVSLKQAIRNTDKAPVVVFELSARTSNPKDPSVWFDTAHDAIVELFLQLSTKEAKKQWEVSQ